MEDLYDAMTRVRAYVESEQYQGYDPCDALNASYDFTKLGLYAPRLATYLHRRAPVNVRPFLGVSRGIHPEALGVFLYAYAQLYEIEKNEYYLEKAHYLVRLIQETMSHGYRGACWGHNFALAGPGKPLPAYTPTVTSTAFVVRGLFKYYLLSKDEYVFSLILSACDFILNDIPLTETEYGLCFSYSPLKRDCCYSASLLAAEVLARGYALTNSDELRSSALRAVDFAVAHQRDDGQWKYSIDIKTGRERDQAPFQQGCIIDCIRDITRFTRVNSDPYQAAILQGAHVYKNNGFTRNGRSSGGMLGGWPVDIRHQAQGIITFSRLSTVNESYGEFAERIARWTVKNMQDKKGHFYYRKHILWANKIPYMRWSQAWMFRAFTQLITTLSLIPAHA